MQVEAKTLVFNDFSHILAQADVMTNPSEVHGTLCGLICIGHKLSGKFWFDTALNVLGAKSLLSRSSRELIISLYAAACRQLSGIQYEFQLLLPDENPSFIERALALSHWCRGFIYGLSLADIPLVDTISEEVQDAIRSINELAKLDFDDIEVSDHDILAYQTVVEFVRTSVIMMYAELMEQPISHSGSLLQPDCLH